MQGIRHASNIRPAFSLYVSFGRPPNFFLGIWFDEKCLWRTQVKEIEAKCNKVLNLMRSVLGYDWGADKQSLLDIYWAVIRSCIDYECMVYGAAAKSVLEKLDRIQFRALRLSS